MSFPLWTQSATIETYGGHAEKRNYLGAAIVNPKTDIDAGQVNRMAADLVAFGRAAPYAVGVIELGASSATWRRWRTQSGELLSLAPVLTRTAEGASFSFPTAATDELGVTADLEIDYAEASACCLAEEDASEPLRLGVAWAGGVVSISVYGQTTGGYVTSATFLVRLWGALG